jgi:hypothetical protein
VKEKPILFSAPMVIAIALRVDETREYSRGALLMLESGIPSRGGTGAVMTRAEMDQMEMTWVGCPNCKSTYDLRVVQETTTNTIMACECGWSGMFSECWIFEKPEAARA